MEDYVSTVGDDYSIDVNTESLGSAHELLKNLLTEISEVLQRADAAGQRAVEAAGGDSTRVGNALKQKLVAVNSVEFSRVTERVADLTNGVVIIETAYAENEEEFVRAIDKYGDGYSVSEV